MLLWSVRGAGALLIVLVLLIAALYAVGISAAHGDVIAYTALDESGISNVTLYDVAHHRLFALAHADDNQHLIGWSADGDQLAIGQIRRAAQTQIVSTHIFDLTTGTFQTYPVTGVYGTYSPDGRLLALIRMIGAREGELLVFDQASGQANTITTDQVRTSGSPIWSQDGHAILFGGRTGDGAYQIYQVRVDTGELTRLTDYAGNNYNPRLSPDGHYLLFQSFQRRSMAVMLLNLTVSNGFPRSLTAGDGFCELPAWSPDSTRVAVICEGLYSTFGKSLFIAYIGTRDVDFLAPNVRPIQPQWTRDGAGILFVGDDGHFYRIGAPLAPIEGNGFTPPQAERLTAHRLFARETYVTIGVRP